MTSGDVLSGRRVRRIAHRTSVAAVSVAVALCTGLAGAGEHTDLTVVRISPPEVRVFDIETLEAMEQVVFTTSTPWTDVPHRYSGIPLARLIGPAPPRTGTVRLVALNDYAVEIPVADVEDALPIVAHSRDGERMSIRDKGPYWVMYPFDEGPDYRSERHFSRSVWQLVRIEVHP